MDKKINYDDLIGLYQRSFMANWDLPAFSDYGGIGLSYGEVAGIISRIHHFFEMGRISRGDKVAVYGRNSTMWGAAFLAVVTYGAVAVPVLPDFNTTDVHHIVNHSDARILFAADQLFQKLEIEKMKDVEAVVSLNRLEMVFTRDEKMQLAWEQSREQQGVTTPDRFKLKPLQGSALCIISYTSGTSGFTKGVMLSCVNLMSNVVFARDHMPLKPGDCIVSFLPMAHVFGLLFEFLFPVTLGCHITFLTKAPTPQVIVAAFKEIRPRLILSVPLVIEKIYRKQILPELEKPLLKVLMKVPGISSVIRRKVRKSLIETFGGRFHEIVIGGAALNREVEDFFRKIKFPFTVGYGMTECAPLIAYAAWNETLPFSAGKLVDRMKVRIDSADPYHDVGEILVKGDNIMLGYYKNEEATRQSIDDEGWLHTGDLGVLGKEQFIFIRGRSKNMLLGPSGQNIYPEEIEAKLSSLPFVSECVVVDRDGKLIALVYADVDAMAEQQVSIAQLPQLMEANRLTLNSELPRYSQIGRIDLVDNEFEKTPKRNIRRYLYT